MPHRTENKQTKLMPTAKLISNYDALPQTSQLYLRCLTQNFPPRKKAEVYEPVKLSGVRHSRGTACCASISV